MHVQRPHIAAGDRLRAARQRQKGIPHDRQVGRPGFGQLQRTRTAMKELPSETPFQRFDLLTDGALGHVELCRRMGEGAVPRGRFERAQPAKRWEGSGHFDNSGISSTYNMTAFFSLVKKCALRQALAKSLKESPADANGHRFHQRCRGRTLELPPAAPGAPEPGFCMATTAEGRFTLVQCLLGRDFDDNDHGCLCRRDLFPVAPAAGRDGKLRTGMDDARLAGQPRSALPLRWAVASVALSLAGAG